MLTILEGYIQQKGIRYCRLDGSTDREIREISIEQFQNASPENNASIQIFLLSTRAGGVGLNLQQADTVILFDSDWNPQQDLQAISRVHRIGQTKPVLILRLLSAGPADDIISVDEYILQKARRKLLTEKKVIADGQFNSLTTTPASTSSFDSDGMFEMFGEEDESPSWLKDNATYEEETTVDFSIEKMVSTLFAKKLHSPIKSSSLRTDNEPGEFVIEELTMNPQSITKLLQRNRDDAQIYSLSINWPLKFSGEWKPWLKLLKPWRNDKKESKSAPNQSKKQQGDSRYQLEDLTRSRRTNIKRKFYGEQLDMVSIVSFLLFSVKLDHLLFSLVR
jgi:superfamily II DNA/RNA helicase